MSSGEKRNAVIMAAGTSSRFVPLSWERPKGLLEVKGEILIERQIRQLHCSGITDITVVTGYMAEKFRYLQDKFGVELVLNEDYSRYNNTSSLVRVLNRLHQTFICSSDNYFPINVFMEKSPRSYYSALYSQETTGEYCLSVNSDDEITAVTVGGKDSWYMIGHVFFSEEFSKEFARLLEREYQKESTRQGYWEDLYIRFIDKLPRLFIHRYKEGEITEFDSIDELRAFDSSYLSDTRSSVVKDISQRLICTEGDLTGFTKISADEFSFSKADSLYKYNRQTDQITLI